jgi:hypothetical protein
VPWHEEGEGRFVNEGNGEGTRSIDLSTLDLNLVAGSLVRDLPGQREAARFRLAIAFLVTFVVLASATLFAGFYIVAIHAASPEDAKRIVLEALIPFLDAVGTFLLKVFGPMLTAISFCYFVSEWKAARTPSPPTTDVNPAVTTVATHRVLLRTPPDE